MSMNRTTSSDTHSRIAREKRTVKAMVEVYCGDHHQPKDGLCHECRELMDYAAIRLDKCPFQEEKTTCANCPVHCYQPAMKERIKEVMRYSGPRMTYRHPVLAVRHMIDSRKKPVRRKGGTSF